MKKAITLQEIIQLRKNIQLSAKTIEQFYVSPVLNGESQTYEAIYQFLQTTYDTPQKIILAGPKGAGKRTLLCYLSNNRLDRFYIIPIHLLKSLDPMDIRPVDFIFCLLHHLIQDLAQWKRRLDPSVINSIYQNLHDEELINILKFKKSEAGDEEGTKIGFVKTMIIAIVDALSTTDTTVRFRVRESLEPCLRLIIRSIQKIIDYMNGILQQKDQKLLIIFDDIDQFDPSTVEPFFKDHFFMTERLHVHMIYTMPDFIRFSNFFEILSQRVDRIIFMRPVPVLNPDQTSFHPGLLHIKKIVDQCIDSQLIPESIYDQIITASGGILHHVFDMLIDTSLNTLIIDPSSQMLLPKAFEKTKQTFSRHLIQQMNQKQIELLKQINLSHPAWYNDKNIQHLMARNILIEYENNGHVWFAVHPLVV
ncbi:ATPase AAA [Candidatus Magnetomorum sp. HK-1]|nr:ATPase AAA [Candidatus Magnetomorum sp. HK-1]